MSENLAVTRSDARQLRGELRELDRQREELLRDDHINHELYMGARSGSREEQEYESKLDEIEGSLDRNAEARLQLERRIEDLESPIVLDDARSGRNYSER